MFSTIVRSKLQRHKAYPFYTSIIHRWAPRNLMNTIKIPQPKIKQNKSRCFHQIETETKVSGISSQKLAIIIKIAIFLSKIDGLA
ncbi:hypothetical protein FGO68_gene13182 [Halteria grandinella]|uniref:Uncharacterized protein n=1 Tax=Halteria grandinella TaxID=5974 RepID=A0A8J8NWL2_HALGN|nr:hypothetical protein FGO68_gene13182 [Halteria grandinella]